LQGIVWKNYNNQGKEWRWEINPNSKMLENQRIISIKNIKNCYDWCLMKIFGTKKTIIRYGYLYFDYTSESTINCNWMLQHYRERKIKKYQWNFRNKYDLDDCREMLGSQKFDLDGIIKDGEKIKYALAWEDMLIRKKLINKYYGKGTVVSGEGLPYFGLGF